MCGMEDVVVETRDKTVSVEAEAGSGDEELTTDEIAEKEAAEEARQAKKAHERELNRKRQARWREHNPKEVIERNVIHYQNNKAEIRVRQNARNAELRLARDGTAGGSLLKFGVTEGCHGSCSPAMCSACLSVLRAERHPVRQRVNEAYEIAAVEEQPIPICAQEESAFRAAVAGSSCKDCCKVLETELRTLTCAFWGQCRRCHAVEHRRRDSIAAQRRFCEVHTEEVKESHRMAHAHWVEWLDSWSFEAEAGAAWRVAFEQELAALIARLR
jgi:hypothetical protein